MKYASMKSYLWPVLLVVWTLALAWSFNHDWYGWTSLTQIRAMNDAKPILFGYHQTPNVLIDGLRWWHGPWIEDGIHVFRPLASYLLWGECWLGLRFGFESVAWVGFVFFVVLCCACAALTWRLTRSLPLTFVSATLAATTPLHIMGGTMPLYWLAWFPVHHDLQFFLTLISALFCLDMWLETQERRHLLATWACFVVSALTKEYAYIFPLLAVWWVWARAEKEVQHAAWRQVAFFFWVAIVLFSYRALILTNPYNPPHLKWVHLLRKPWMYWFPPFYRYVLSNDWFIPGLAALLYALGAAWRRALQIDEARQWFLKPGAASGVIAANVVLVGLYLQVATGSVFDALWILFESRTKVFDLAYMTFLFYVVGLIWRTRSQKFGVLALVVLITIYLPVFTYLGWHYTLAGWFIRASVWWPIIIHLVAKDWSVQPKVSINAIVYKD
jgi:hypothetical protein